MPKSEDQQIHQRARRAPLTLACDVRQGHRPWARSRLLNLSETGFCTVWMPALEVKRGLWLRIPGLQLLKASIRWRSAGVMGCEFEAPLHPAVFEHVVRQTYAPPGAPPAQMWAR